MAVTAPVPGFSLAALARLTAALPLPGADVAPGPQSRLPDVVVFSSGPMRLLSDLASAGLRQLAALVPALEQAVQDENVVPLGHLAKATAAAARQVAEGHAALLAEGPDRVAAALPGQTPLPGAAPPDASETKQVLRALARQLGAEAEPAPDPRVSETLRLVARQLGAATLLPEPPPAAGRDASPAQRWLGEAKQILHSAGDILERAEDQLRPTIPLDPTKEPAAAWAIAQIVSARVQLADAVTSLGRARAEILRSRAAPSLRLSAFPIDQLAGAAGLLGVLMTLALLWIAGISWAVMSGLAALVATAIWVWRIGRASRGIVLDARR